MLAGLSKLPILRIPPCFAPMPSPWAATARSLSRAREDLASFRPPPVRNAGGKDPHCRCAGPFWALVQAATSERLSSIGLRRNRGSVSTFDRVVAGPPCRKAAACRARGLRSASCAQPCVSTIDVSESRVCRSRESGSGTPLTSWQRAEHGCSPAIIWRFTMRCVAAALRVLSMSSSAGARRGVNGDRSGCGKRPADPPLQKTSSLPTLRWRRESRAISSLESGIPC